MDEPWFPSEGVAEPTGPVNARQGGCPLPGDARDGQTMEQTETAGQSAARSVKSAARVFDGLEYLAPLPQGAGFMQIGAALGIPKSSLHALLDAMPHRGYLVRDPERRRYRLGLRVWEAGQACPRHHDLLDVAREVLRATVAVVNETAQLAQLSGAENG